MIKVDRVSIRYQDWVLRSVSCHISAGSTVAILGPNGRGKSSLLRVMAGVSKPTEGSVTVNSHVAYVPQFISLSFDMTVKDFLLTGRSRQIGWIGKPSHDDWVAVEKALQRLGIGHYANRFIHQLSGGQRQLVMVARAIASGCQVVLLDEPASALDFHNQAIMLAVMDDLAKSGMTIVFTTHLPQHALEIASHSLLLFNADDYLSGRTESVLTTEHLSRLYNLSTVRSQIYYGPSFAETATPIYRSLNVQ